MQIKLKTTPLQAQNNTPEARPLHEKHRKTSIHTPDNLELS